MTKDDRQKEAVKRFIASNGKGSFDFVQRFGKTLTGIKLAHYYHTKIDSFECIVVVPSVYISTRWEEELALYPININIKVITVDSILRNSTYVYTCDLLIVDEIHKFTSDNRINVINKTFIKYKMILGLTGSYPYNNKNINNIAPIIDTINEYDAITNGWISNFITYNIPLELSDSDKVEYIRYSTIMYEVSTLFRGVSKLIINRYGTRLFKNDLEVILSCYSGKTINKIRIKSQFIREFVANKMGWEPNLKLDNDYNIQRDKYWNPDNIKESVTRYYRAMKSRNSIHNINNVKLDAVLRIYSKFNNNTIMVFNESIEFATIIADSINNMFNTHKAVVYYSSMKGTPLYNFIDNSYFKDSSGNIKKFGKTRYLRYVTDMLKIGYYNLISTVKALDEGFNVENIDIAITTSGTSNPTQYSQRSARPTTVDYYNPTKVAIIINLYFDDFLGEVNGAYKMFHSRDKVKLMIRQGNINTETLTLDKFLNKN